MISITDGQIYLEPDLFYQGNRPAINAGISVSRVGSSAQIKAMKKVAGKMRLDVAQYRELAAFAQFSSDLDQETKNKLERGRRIVEVLKQAQYVPMPVEKQVAVFFAVTSGLMDDVPSDRVGEFEAGMLSYIENKSADLLAKIKQSSELEESVQEGLKKAIGDFKDSVDYLEKAF